MHAVQTQLLPEEVNNTLKVSGDKNHKGDDCGEDQGWGWSQSVDVSHGQNVGLRKTTTGPCEALRRLSKY